MAKLSIQAGSTGETIEIFLQNNSVTTGVGLTGVTYQAVGLTGVYNFERTAAVGFALANPGTVTGVWTSAGLIEINNIVKPGAYRLDIPNNCLAAGNGRYCNMMIWGATNMAPCSLELELTGWNNQDSTRGGLTALPNANCSLQQSLATTGNILQSNIVQVNGSAISGSPTYVAVTTTGTFNANLISSSPGVSVSVTGTVQSNVVSFSGTPVVAANISGAIIADIRYIQGQLSSLYDGIAQSGTINTIKLAQKEPNVDQYYQWCYMSVLAASGGFQYGLITSYSGASRTAYMDRNWSITPDSNGNTNYTFIGYARDNPIYVNNQLLGTKAGLNFNTFFQNAGNTTADIVDNVGTGGSSSGVTDWTTTERSQIRYLLGVDGSATVPVTAKPAITTAVTGTLPGANVVSINPGLTISVTGTPQVNMVSANPGVTVSITGTNTFSSTDISQLRYKMGIDGTSVAPSTPYAGNLELSLSGLHNIMVENGINMNQWMEAVGSVIAGSSTVNANSITYYAMNNNGVTRVSASAISGARQSIVLFLS